MRDAIRTEGGDADHLISRGAAPAWVQRLPRRATSRASRTSALVHMYPRPDDPATTRNELQADIKEIRNSKPPGQPLVVDETYTFVHRRDRRHGVRARDPARVDRHHRALLRETPAQLTPPPTIADALAQLFYKMFLGLTPTMLDPIALAGGLGRSAAGAAATPPPPPSDHDHHDHDHAATTAAASSTTYLSDLSTTVAVNGFGPFERNRANGGSAANDGPALKIRGVTYAKGLGVNAYSELEFPIPSGATSFRASIGVDDSACASSMRVELKLNGITISVSGLPASFTKSSPAYSLSVNVTGKTRLRLHAVNTGTASSCDHFDWADARFLFPGSTTTTSSTTTTTKAPTPTTVAPTTTVATHDHVVRRRRPRDHLEHHDDDQPRRRHDHDDGAVHRRPRHRRTSPTSAT